MDQKDLKIEFAPGVLEELEANMTPEELQDFMNFLKEQIENGSFLDQSTPVDMEDLQENDPVAYQMLVDAIENPDQSKRTLH